MNLFRKMQPVPAVLTPKLSKLEIREELGVLYVLVDGETKLSMPAEQAILFFEFALKRAYRIQLELNRVQQQQGDPTAHCKSGGVSLRAALLQRL